MYYGSKGWYVKELKKLGVNKHGDLYIESYKQYKLAQLLKEYQTKKSGRVR
ncbi:DUF2639 domain-containing protein [Bacillus carboniphilus]|uniref:DUF2639 domain-containing protein n=1 Tax=Bacillus carboniphilus TaxID=86663 RepID=A0ABY9JVL8_9BACI|nr:DUF2639 domain-containing protein [Bacillus carboniphilus]WLR42465.1 DUF2639 domain-containing protein [Bacillus carboniphilus]